MDADSMVAAIMEPPVPPHCVLQLNPPGCVFHPDVHGHAAADAFGNYAEALKSLRAAVETRNRLDRVGESDHDIEPVEPQTSAVKRGRWRLTTCGMEYPRRA
jgi:hypothetical protein